MSELDLIIKRKKSDVESNEVKKENSETEVKQLVETKDVSKIEGNSTKELNSSNKEDKSPDVKSEKDKSLVIKEKMKEFIQKDPKIGVWSYQAFLVLQYLYHTVPSFKMSKVAKEALEKGLSEMYPELFKIATELAKEEKKI
ncbi:MULTISPECIES: hypothetical protein [unclassified Stygiolobus]|jgi:hypothetical protein|uniref:hypothetical protein n=1 Tax=unclassified Stygiolobus TaxID=2824672 RepID=UPI00307F4112